jgi:ABC-type multidrug transport system fused ATPase/permease subunit
MKIITYLKEVGYFIIPYYKLFGVLVIISSFMAFLEVINIAVFFPLLNFLSSGEVDFQSSNNIIAFLNSWIRYIDPENIIYSSSLILIFVSLLTFFVKIFYHWLSRIFIGDVIHKENCYCIEKYASAPYSYLISIKSGEAIFNCDIPPSHVGKLTGSIPEIVTVVFRIIVFSFFLASLHFGAFSLITLILIIFIAASYTLSKTVGYRASQLGVKASKDKAQIIILIITGLKEILINDVTKTWLKKHHNFSLMVKKVRVAGYMVEVMPGIVIESLLFIGVGIFLLIVSQSPETGWKNYLPVIGTFVLALSRIIPSVKQLQTLLAQFFTILPNIQSMYKLRHEDFGENRWGEIPFHSFKKQIRFQNVSYKYPGANEKIFEDLNFSIPKNKTTAFVGSSGSGKTTLLNMLLGLFQPDKGDIFFDSIPMSQLEISSWRKRLGFVSQDMFLFHGTVYENVQLLNASVSLDEVIEKCKIAQIHDFIETLPEGYQTIIGDRGLKLSGGQRQRLAIARALIGDPELLIFDEATSALDNVSERKITEAIESIAHHRTVVIVAHRLSTVVNSDHIVVLDQGKIVEEGSHQTLMEEKGHYFKNFQTPSSKDMQE